MRVPQEPSSRARWHASRPYSRSRLRPQTRASRRRWHSTRRAAGNAPRRMRRQIVVRLSPTRAQTSRLLNTWVPSVDVVSSRDTSWNSTRRASDAPRRDSARVTRAQPAGTLLAARDSSLRIATRVVLPGSSPNKRNLTARSSGEPRVHQSANLALLANRGRVRGKAAR
jgi:hypothetical protein